MGSGGGVSESILNNIIFKIAKIFLHPLPVGKIYPPRTPGNDSMRENIPSTGGLISSTIPAMLKSSSRRLFSRHALRVQQHAPNMLEKTRNIRIPDVVWSIMLYYIILYYIILYYIILYYIILLYIYIYIYILCVSAGRVNVQSQWAVRGAPDDRPLRH